MLNHLKVKGFTMPLNILVMLLVGAIVVFIILVALYVVFVGNVKDIENHQDQISKDVEDSIPVIGSIVLFLPPIRKKSSLSLQTIFYLLLGILVVGILIIALTSLSSKGKEVEVKTNPPKNAFECSKKCATQQNFNQCYEECVNSISTSNTNNESTKSGGGSNNRDKKESNN